MGWYFQLEHANLVAYLTTPGAKPPTVLFRDVASFLDGLRQGWQKTLISSDGKWPELMGNKAAEIFKDIPPEKAWMPDPVEPRELERLIGPLRDGLSNYGFYALSVFDDQSPDLNKRLDAFMQNGAYESKGDGLFLITDQWRPLQCSFLDPFPPLQQIAKHPGNMPGVVFWTEDAVACAHIKDAHGLLAEILDAARHSRAAISEAIRKFSLGPAEKRLLHLSDLHFGTKRATEMQAFLMSSIARESDQVDRVVVTGDLFDTPNEDAFNAFRNFQMQLERASKTPLLLVPGNHDESFRGNRFRWLGRLLKEAAMLDWKTLEIDDDMQCVFFGFDSALEARISAQGIVTREQLVRVGTQYQHQLDLRPELAKYLKIALIHHHPYSWRDSEPVILGYSIEDLLHLEESENFINWCCNRDVSLVLHGHKHVPRHVVDYSYREGRSHLLTSIGCGTSLGAEKRPLSYNIVSWHPESQKWGAAFFVDPGDASGFKQKYVTITNARNN